MEAALVEGEEEAEASACEQPLEQAQSGHIRATLAAVMMTHAVQWRRCGDDETMFCVRETEKEDDGTAETCLTGLTV